jgi:hypothetical protein
LPSGPGGVTNAAPSNLTPRYQPPHIAARNENNSTEQGGNPVVAVA